MTRGNWSERTKQFYSYTPIFIYFRTKHSLSINRSQLPRRPASIDRLLRRPPAARTPPEQITAPTPSRRRSQSQLPPPSHCPPAAGANHSSRRPPTAEANHSSRYPPAAGAEQSSRRPPAGAKQRTGMLAVLLPPQSITSSSSRPCPS